MKDLYLLLDKYIEKHSISTNQLEFYLKEGTRNFFDNVDRLLCMSLNFTEEPSF
jgi:hypothetical protein